MPVQTQRLQMSPNPVDNTLDVKLNLHKKTLQ